jgi:hypothetical protein
LARVAARSGLPVLVARHLLGLRLTIHKRRLRLVLLERLSVRDVRREQVAVRR